MYNDAYTKLAIAFEGTDGSTTFTDISPAARTLTALTGVEIDTSTYAYGSSSMLCEAEATGLQAAYGSDLDITEDFTVAFSIKSPEIPYGSDIKILEQDDGLNVGIQVSITNYSGNPQLLLYLRGVDGYAATTGFSDFDDDTWYDVEICGLDNGIFIRIDGNLVFQDTTVGPWDTSDVESTWVTCKSNYNAPSFHIDNFEFSNGISRSGGVNLVTEDVSDSIEAVDTLDSLANFNSSILDLLDLLDRAPATYDISVLENFNFAASTALTFYLLNQDSISLLDNSSFILILQLFEALHAADNHLVSWNSNTSILDNLSAYDDIKLQFIKAITETLELTDNTSAMLELLLSEFIVFIETARPNWNTTRSISENLTIESTIASQLYLTITESLELTESQSEQLSLFIIDFLQAYDSIILNSNTTRTVSDSIYISESIVQQISLYLTESLELTDAQGAQIQLVVSEFIAIIDTLVINSNTTRTVSETLEILDSFSVVLQLFITDYLGLTDEQSAQLQLYITELISFASNAVVNWNSIITINELLRTADDAITAFYMYITESVLLSESQIVQLQITINELITIIENITLNWNTNRTINESLSTTDFISFITNLILFDNISITDSQIAHLQITVNEIITTVENIIPNWNTTRSLTESLSILDSIYQQLLIILTESLTITDSSPISQLGLAIYEYLGFTESLLSSGIFYNSLSESIHNTDILNIGYAEFITDIFSLVDTSDTVRLLLNFILDTFTLSEIAAAQLKSIIPITDSLTLIDTISNKGLIYNTVRDAISLNITIELDNDIWECYVLNTPKFFPSIYSGFNFNSYCVFQNRAYGAKLDGIYELSGSTDNGIAISTGVLLSETTFNLPNQKRFRKAYLGVSGTTPVLIAETETGKSITYTIDSAGEADMSRLLKSKKWKLTVSNFSTLDFIKLIPVILAK